MNKCTFFTHLQPRLAAWFGVIASLAFAAQMTAADLTLGVQTWTLRNLNFDQVVAFAAKHNLKYLQFIANHFDPMGPKEEWARKKAILDQHGLVAYTFGVANTTPDKETNRKLFEFAKFMGMKLIIIEPRDFKILDNLEELAKEYDIKIAIHNHGLKSLYGNPDVVRNLIQHRDPRVGVCLDAGWVASGRYDSAKVFKDYGGRVFDIHLKDKKVSSTSNGDVAVDTFLGEGDANLKELFKVAKQAGYTGVFAIETDNNLKDPNEHVAKAIEFFKSNQP